MRSSNRRARKIEGEYGPIRQEQNWKVKEIEQEITGICSILNMSVMVTAKMGKLPFEEILKI